MRAAERCKEHSQGDKCRKSLHHTSDHEGQFTIWNDRRRTEKYPRLSAKRNRGMNRFLRHLSPVAPLKERGRIMSLLEMAIKSLRKL